MALEAPSGSKSRPRGPQGDSGKPRVPSRFATRDLYFPKRIPRGTQKIPRRPRDAPNRPQEPQQAPKRTPKGGQQTPRSPQRHLAALRVPSKFAFSAQMWLGEIIRFPLKRRAKWPCRPQVAPTGSTKTYKLKRSSRGYARFWSFQFAP